MNESTGQGELPVITIMQGRSEPTHFWIIQPVPGIEFTVGQEVHCIHPKTRKLTKGRVTGDTWTFLWDEAPKGFLMGFWSVDPQLLRTVLIGTDEGFNDPWARVIQLKEIP